MCMSKLLFTPYKIVYSELYLDLTMYVSINYTVVTGISVISLNKISLLFKKYTTLKMTPCAEISKKKKKLLLTFSESNSRL